jgi:hypothetical protein
LDGSLGFDGGDSGVDVLGDNVSTVHQATGHVFSVSWVAFGHHGSGLESGVGDLGDGKLLVVSFFGGDHWGVGRKHKVNSWVWDQVSLELGNIDVEGSVKSEGSGQTGNDLGYQSVKVGVCWALNIERSAADVVDRFVVKHDGNVGVLEKGVGGKNAIVWLNNGGGNLGGWVDAESQFGFTSVVNGKSFEQKGAESGSGTTSNSVEAEESLESGTVISELANSVEDEVNNFFSDGVVTTGVVVSGVFLSSDDLFWVVQLSVRASSDFVTDGRFEVN